MPCECLLGALGPLPRYSDCNSELNTARNTRDSSIRTAAQPLVSRLSESVGRRASGGINGFQTSGSIQVSTGNLAVYTNVSFLAAVRNALSVWRTENLDLSGESNVNGGDVANSIKDDLQVVGEDLNSQRSDVETLARRLQNSLNVSTLSGIHTIVDQLLLQAYRDTNRGAALSLTDQAQRLSPNYVSTINALVDAVIRPTDSFSSTNVDSLVDRFSGETFGILGRPRVSRVSLWGLYYTPGVRIGVVPVGGISETSNVETVENAIRVPLGVSPAEVSALRAQVDNILAVYAATYEELEDDYCSACEGGNVTKDDQGNCICVEGFIKNIDGDCVESTDGCDPECEEDQECIEDPVTPGEFVCADVEQPLCSEAQLATPCLIPGQVHFFQEGCPCGCPDGQTIIEIEGQSICGVQPTCDDVEAPDCGLDEDGNPVFAILNPYPDCWSCPEPDDPTEETECPSSAPFLLPNGACGTFEDICALGLTIEGFECEDDLCPPGDAPVCAAGEKPNCGEEGWECIDEDEEVFTCGLGLEVYTISEDPLVQGCRPELLGSCQVRSADGQGIEALTCGAGDVLVALGQNNCECQDACTAAGGTRQTAANLAAGNCPGAAVGDCITSSTICNPVQVVASEPCGGSCPPGFVCDSQTNTCIRVFVPVIQQACPPGFEEVIVDGVRACRPVVDPCVPSPLLQF